MTSIPAILALCSGVADGWGIMSELSALCQPARSPLMAVSSYPVLMGF